MKKPDPRIFTSALSATGLMPSEVVYVGDTAEDVEAAYSAKMTPIQIDRLTAPLLDFESDSQGAMSAGKSKTVQQCKTISHLKELLYLS